jgi:hypothetical protein
LRRTPLIMIGRDDDDDDEGNDDSHPHNRRSSGSRAPIDGELGEEWQPGVGGGSGWDRSG